MKEFILSIDQGTTGTTALLISAENFEFVDKVNLEFQQFFPKPGWVEHDLDEIWNSVEKSIEQVLEKNNICGQQIKSIGITNQRETTCAYDQSGSPLANAIVWQDRRTSDYCKNKNSKYESFQHTTGLPLDPYFSATKMNWLLQNNINIQKAAKEKNLHLSTIDSFLLFKMTSGESFFTEASNASRTLLMDLDTCDWSNELLTFFEIEKDFLPKIKDSFTHFGTTSGLQSLPNGIPITCMLGDQQAALLGQAAYQEGQLKCTYGTGAFILLNTGEKKLYSSNGLLTTVAYKINNRPCYALEGSCYIAGAAVQWLRDNLELIQTASDVENLAKKVKSLDEMEHLIFFPFFTGIGSPHWRADAKCAIMGITRDTRKEHIARACLDGIALSVNDSIEALIKDSPVKVNSIRVDGGASLNNLLLQIQSDFSNKEIIRPKVIETTAYGVALGSLIGTGKLTLDNLKDLWKRDRTFTPVESSYSNKKKEQWLNCVKKIFVDN